MTLLIVWSIYGERTVLKSGVFGKNFKIIGKHHPILGSMPVFLEVDLLSEGNRSFPVKLRFTDFQFL